MGKALNGKELGKGLTQEKSSLYVARFVDRFGKRQSKRFKKLQEAKQWLADSTYFDEHSNPLFPQYMTVDSWFEYWIEMKKTSVRPGTIDTYTSHYKSSVKPVIGDMKIADIKPLHCQLILNKMAEAGYHNGTIKHVRIVMHVMFEDAKDNDIIMSNPMKKSFKCEIGKPKKVRDALTEEEQKIFLNAIIGHRFETQFRFVLQTGLRVGELIGLKWEDIDFKNKCLTVKRTMSYNYATGDWRVGPPKSQSGRRTIPLTDEAIRLLKEQQEKNNQIKVLPIEYAEYVFIDSDGVVKQGAYYAALDKCICRKTGLRHISMHILRHTFATRCAMGGMPPKTLQTYLGHSTISVTMDFYVHTSRDEVAKELDKVSSLLNAI